MCLPHITNSDFSGRNGTVAGWGVQADTVNNEINGSPKHMYKVTVPIFEHDSPRCNFTR